LIARAAITIGIQRAANAGLGFAVAVVLARALGPYGYGIYSTALVVASTMAIFVKFGLPNLVMRETAAAAVDDDESRMADVWAWATRNALVISFVLVAVGGSILYLRSGTSTTEIWTYAFALAFVPFVALGAIRAGALNGLRHVVLAQLPEQVVKPGMMLVMALSLGSLLPASPSVAMAMQFIAIAISFAVGAALLRKKRPADAVRSHNPLSHTSMPSLRSAAAFALVSGATQINQYADVLTISLFGSPEEVGIYRAVWQLSLLISFGTAIAAAIITPLFARYHRQGDRLALLGALHKARLLGLAVALPALLFILVYGENLISYLFGAGFTVGAPVLIILALTQTANALFGPLGQLLSMTGHEAISARLHILAAGANIALNLLLVPQYGIMGAALATLGSYLILNIFLIRGAYFVTR